MYCGRKCVPAECECAWKEIRRTRKFGGMGNLYTKWWAGTLPLYIGQWELPSQIITVVLSNLVCEGRRARLSLTLYISHPARIPGFCTDPIGQQYHHQSNKYKTAAVPTFSCDTTGTNVSKPTVRLSRPSLIYTPTSCSDPSASSSPPAHPNPSSYGNAAPPHAATLV